LDVTTKEPNSRRLPFSQVGEAVEHYSNNCSSNSSIDEINHPQTIETTVTEIQPSARSHVSKEGALGVTSNREFNHISVSSKQTRDAIKQGEEEMAEVDTSMLAGQHADIRREGSVERGEIRYDVATRAGDIRREIADAKDVLNDSIRVEGGNTRAQSAAETSDVIKESIKGNWHNSDAIKDARYDLADRIGNSADRIADRLSEHHVETNAQFFAVGRDTQDIRAQIIAQQQQMVAGFMGVSKDTELASLKGIIEGQKNTQYLADKIAMESEKTRDLLNDHKYHDLNRNLVERNSELVNCEQDRGRYRDRYWDSRWEQNQNQFGAQFAAMQNQLQSLNQNFNSQLAETRQGMVNFGTMAGNAGQQSSTSNNVR
jgi:hypothetical protein